MIPALRRTGLGLLALFLALPATAQEKHNIAINAKPGMSWEFSSVLDSTMTIKSAAGGQQQTMENAGVVKRGGTITVREAAGGRPSVITVAFARDSSSSMKQNGQELAPAFALAGQTVTLKRAADGTFSHDFKGNIDPQSEAELKEMIEFANPMYPKQPVAVGEEWTPEGAKLKEQLQIAPDDKLDLKCKLQAIGSVRGIRTYDIIVIGSVNKTEGGVQANIRIGGVMQVETSSGLPVQSDVVIGITINGNQQAPGADGAPIAVTVNGNGQIKIVGSATPKEGFAGGDVATDGPNPLDPQPNPNPQPNPLDPKPNPLDPKPNPLDPNPKPRPKNPLAVEEEVSPFTGAFKGRQLSAEFQVTGGKMIGTIKLGPKNFPAVGAVDGARLTGSFEADGAKFDFIATLQGTTLTLDSEGNKYTLEKEAAAVPAKPKNPLE